MINIIAIDKNQNSKGVLISFIEKMNEINLIKTYDDFNFSFEDLNQINAIIFDINLENIEKIKTSIQKIKDNYPKMTFIAISYEMDSNFTKKVLEFCDDFLLKPVLFNILEASIKKNVKKNSSNEELKNNVITIFSNKGGIGKTSLAVNLAYELSKQTIEKVCLLNLNLNCEDTITFLNMQPNYPLSYVVSKIESSNEDDFLTLMNNYQNSNFYVLSDRLNVGADFLMNKAILRKLILSLKNIFKYIIIDTTSVIDEKNATLIQDSDLVLIMTLPNISSIRSSQTCIEFLDKIGYSQEKIKLVVNRFIEKSQITLDDIEKTIGEKIFSKIPNNYLTLVDSINSGEPLGQINPNSNIAKAYKKLASDIINIKQSEEKLNVTKYDHGIFNLLHKMGE